MSDAITTSRASALARAAAAMLRALGGGEIVIRCPSAPAGNMNRAELGIDGPVTVDLCATPVAARSIGASSTATNARRRVEFVFAVASISGYLADRAESAEHFFASALGIVQGDALLHIEKVTIDTFAGEPYLYRVIAAES